jgi:hypothetical protein
MSVVALFHGGNHRTYLRYVSLCAEPDVAVLFA